MAKINTFQVKDDKTLSYIIRYLNISVGSNLVQFEVRFGFLRFGRFEVRFLGQIWRFGRFEVRFKGSANLSEPL